MLLYIICKLRVLIKLKKLLTVFKNSLEPSLFFPWKTWFFFFFVFFYKELVQSELNTLYQKGEEVLLAVETRR